MREIKFQGVDENNKIYNLIGINYSNNTGLCKVDGVIGYTWNRFKKFRQFTGLEDKNGKEIYEGDIVNVKYSDGSGYDNPVEISFEKGSFWCGMGYLNDIKIIEVIGNIYENPNLLTK